MGVTKVVDANAQPIHKLEQQERIVLVHDLTREPLAFVLGPAKDEKGKGSLKGIAGALTTMLGPKDVKAAR